MRKYKCLKCGAVVKGQYKESPQKGSYYSVKCICGNRGSSETEYNIKTKTYRFYIIDGFEEIKE